MSGLVRRAGVLLGIFVLLHGTLNAASITSSGTGGNWSSPSTWIGGTVPGSNDDVTVASGSTVIVDADAEVKSLNIIGTLQYEAAEARVLTVANIVTINPDATFSSSSAGTVKNHRLNVGGSIINSGTLNFSTNSNEAGVELVFTGSSNAIFNCSDAVLTNLMSVNGLLLDKGTSPASVLSFNPGNNFQVLSVSGSAARGFLTIVNGTFNVIGSGNFANPVLNTDGDFIVPASGGFWLGNENATVLWSQGNAINYGELKLTNGTLRLGASGDNAIENRDNGKLEIAGGLVVAGRLNVVSGKCSISGGTVRLAEHSGTSGSGPEFKVAPAAKFEMYGTPLVTLAFANSAKGLANDIEILEGSGSKIIKGGTVQLGTEATPAGSSFLVCGEKILSRLKNFNECDIQVVNTSNANLPVTAIGALPVIVFDKTAPTLSAPAKLILKCTDVIPQAYSSLTEFTDAGGSASDNCTIAPGSFKLIKQIQSRADCPFIINRTYEVSDVSGNKTVVVHQLVVGELSEEIQEEALITPQLQSAAVAFNAVKSGNWNDPATWGGTSAPTAADNVVITSPYTVTVDGAGFCNDIAIQSGATLNYSGANALQVNGNWTNNGTYNAGTNGAVEFAGTSTAIVGGSALTVFKRFAVNKGALTNSIQVTSNIQLDGDIVLTSGTMQVNAGVTVNCTHNTGLTIEPLAGIKILGTFNGGAFTIDNKGLFEVAGGTANLGTAAGNSLVVMNSGRFVFSSGLVNVAGRLELSGGDASISGGTLNINTVGNNSGTASLYLSPTSTLNMTAGNIVFKNANSGGGPDMFIETGGAKSFTGGRITFGSGTAGTYRISSEVYPFPSNISAASGANLIPKLFIRGSGTYNFPLFDNSGGAIPATVDLSGGSLGSGSYIQMETYPPKHQRDANGPPYPNRYWALTTSSISNPAYTVSASYKQSELVNSPTTLVAASYQAGKAKKIAGAKITTNTISFGSNSTFQEFSLMSAPTVTITANTNPICSGSSANLTATVSGDGPFTYSWTSAPAGFNSNIQNVSVSPVVTTVYTISVTDVNTLTTTSSITVNVNPDNTVTAASSTPTICVNTALTPITHTTTGASGIGVPTGLPTGVSASWSANTITVSGTPSVSGTFNYSIPLIGGCGAVNATGQITVTPNNTVTAASSTPTICVNTALVPITHTTTGASGIGVPTGLPTGVSASWSANTITVSGTPSVSGTFNYSIPLTGGCGTVNATGQITVTPNNTVTAASSTPTICVNTALVPITHTTTGASGIGVPTGLPTGVSASWSANTITVSGTPSVSGTFNYSIPLTGGCGAVNANGTITVNPLPTITLGAVATICPGASGFQLPYTATTGAPTTYSISAGTPALAGFTPVVDAVLGASPLTVTLPGTVPAGTYQFNITVKNGNGCVSANQTFNLTVLDNTPPVISGCPANMNVNTGAGRTTCNQVATWTEPTALDNCSGVLSYSTRSHAPGDLFAVGTTTVTYTFKDTSGNTATCTFSVTVVDNTPPTFTVPAATTIYTNASCGINASPAQTGSPFNLFDNCTAAPSLTVNYTDVTGTVSCSYTITRSWGVRDAAGNTNTQTQIITVVDNVRPLITVPNDITIQCGTSTSTANTGGTATATDNCGGPVVITFTDSAPVGGTCDKTFTRTWKATDACGNSQTGDQFIRITDTQAPVVSALSPINAACPSDIPLPNVGLVSATDNCGTVSVTLYNEIANGLTGKPGYCPSSITRIYRVADNCGNFADVTQTITVTYTGPSCTTCERCAWTAPYTTYQSFHTVDFTGNPSGTYTVTVIRRDKCCPDVKSNEFCASFNILLDKDAVGVIVNVSGVNPQGQTWRLDCTTDVQGGDVVCIPPGAFHLFTYCKSGQGEPQLGNTYVIQSVKGAAASNDLNTRVDCTGQLHVTGVTAPVWHSISPGAYGAYDSYLNVTDPYNPIFTASTNSPSVIQYQVCGNLGSTICSGISTDCDVVTVYIKDKIDISLNINPDVVCQDNIPTITPSISPAGTYVLDWKSPSGTVVRANSYTPAGEGTYTLTVSDIQSGILCNTKDFPFTITFDHTGPSIQAPPAALKVQCNDPNYQSIINAWRSSATATYINAQGNTVTATVTNDFDFSKLNMTCGNVVSVTFSAVDQCSNSNLATSTITVIDNIKPTITTQSNNLTVECDGAGNVAAYNAWLASNGGAVATDDCGTVSWTYSVTPLSDLCGLTGVATVTFTARDACGNGATSTGIFTVIDTTPPVISNVPAAITVSCASNVPPALTSSITATDVCSGPVNVVVADVTTPGSCPNRYSITRKWTATDACGNSSSATQVITVDDNTPPSISCPGPYYQNANPGTCTAFPVAFGTATATDACGGVVSVTNNAPASFPVGITTVTWTATDACGNVSTCSQFVTIYDVQPPVINCVPTVYNATVGPGSCGTPVGMVTPTYTENCGAPITVSVVRSDGLSISADFPVGVTTVVWTVTDASNNATTCTQTVVVTDNIAPTISCPANVVALAPVGNCQMVVTPIAPPTVADNCGTYTLTWTKTGTTTGTGTGDVNGTVFNGGVTTVTYTATDAAGNSASCSFTVTVNDQVPPTIITCPSNVVDNSLATLCVSTLITIPQPTAIDPCGVIVSMTHNSPYATGSSTTDASGIYPVGVTTITWTVTDNGGNIATCVQIVTVNDRELPTLVCPGNATYPADPNKPYKTNVPVPAPTYSDNCPNPLLTWTMGGATTDTSSNSSGISFVPNPYPQLNVGNTIITYTITDASGQAVSCSFTITIVSKPQIACAASVTTDTESNNCGATLDPGIPTLIDGAQPITWTWTIDSPISADVSGMSTSTVSDPTPDPIGPFTFDHGTTTITWTATNISGTDSCTQTITVIDNVPPIYTPPPTTVEFCVVDIISAIYAVGDPDVIQVNPEPDYYLLVRGNASLDLTITNLNDNCCTGTISWTINFSNIPSPQPSISGTGQPSAYTIANNMDIKLWGDGVTYTSVTHQIDYTVTDCHGNSTSFTRPIIIDPRPQIIKSN